MSPSIGQVILLGNSAAAANNHLEAFTGLARHLGLDDGTQQKLPSLRRAASGWGSLGEFIYQTPGNHVMLAADYRLRPSGRHPNRKAHNWLAYDCMDRSFKSASSVFRGTVYDLGCGEAPYRDWILQHAARYVGVDWAESLHDVKADIVANLNDPLPIEDEVADTVLSVSVLEHLQKPQLMLSEAWRILRPGGHLVLQVPWQWRIHEAPHDYYRYTPYGLRYLLEQARFREIDVQPQGGFFTMLVLKLNYASRGLVRGPRPVTFLLGVLFSIGWHLGQFAAPILDRLDKSQVVEAPGYFVIARKPTATSPEAA